LKEATLMKPSALILAFLALCAGSALAAETPLPPPGPSTPPGAAPAPAAPPSAVQTKISTQDYVNKAITGDLFEVEASKLAQEKAQGAPVKEFAKQMIDDHSEATEKIKGALPKSEGIKFPPGLDSKHQEMLKQLQAAKGVEFDKLYLDMQIAAHEDGWKLHKAYGDSGDVPALKAAANELAKVVEAHLTRVREIAGPAEKA
jgi:putative membrane protein